MVDVRGDVLRKLLEINQMVWFVQDEIVLYWINLF